MSDLTAAQAIAEELDRWKGRALDVEVSVPDQILAALAAAGYAVVKLPPADNLRSDEWRHGQVLATRDVWLGVTRFTPAEAREVAAALLAAAQAAEAGR